MASFVNGVNVSSSGGGSGTIHTSSPLSGDGSSGTPATIANGAIADASLATSYLKADGSRALTAAWSTGAFDVTFGGKIIGGTIGPVSGQQHTLPAVASDTVTLLAASQNLTNKTITSAILSGTHTGNTVLSGQITFSNGTAPIISATIGPASGQQHTIPAVTSDTLALLAATQTLAGKTLTSPKINVGSDAQGDVYYRDGSGNFARLAPGTAGQLLTSGGAAANPTWTTVASGGSPFVVTDATTNDLTQVIEVRHMTSGTAANGIASAMFLSVQDTSGAVQGAARLAGIALNDTAGASFTGAMDFWTWTGSAWNRRMRLGADGGLLVGITLALGAVGIGLPKDTPLYGGNAGGTAYSPMIQMQSGTQVKVGDASATTTQIAGSAVTLYSGGALNLFLDSGALASVLHYNIAYWGYNDSTSTPGSYTHRCANAAGANIAASLFTMQSSLGTGTGAQGYLSLKGSIQVASGSGQHTAGESARVYGQYFVTPAARSRNRTPINDSDYTALLTDDRIAYTALSVSRTVTGPVTSSLPAGVNIEYTITDETGSASAIKTITFAPASGTIDGVASKALINGNIGLLNESVRVYFDGTNWHSASS